jgi:hypothetical protein
MALPLRGDSRNELNPPVLRDLSGLSCVRQETLAVNEHAAHALQDFCCDTYDAWRRCLERLERAARARLAASIGALSSGQRRPLDRVHGRATSDTGPGGNLVVKSCRTAPFPDLVHHDPQEGRSRQSAPVHW